MQRHRTACTPVDDDDIGDNNTDTYLNDFGVNQALTCYLELISKNQRITSDWVDLLGVLLSFKDWLRFGSTNLLYFVRKPGHIELRRDPRFDF